MYGELAAATRLVSAGIILLSIGCRHSVRISGTVNTQGRRGWNGRGRTSERKTGKLASGIRTHKSSILHVSMAPGNSVRFVIFLPPLFSLSSRFCFPYFPLLRLAGHEIRGGRQTTLNRFSVDLWHNSKR